MLHHGYIGGVFTVVSRRTTFHLLFATLVCGLTTSGCGTWRFWPFGTQASRSAHEGARKTASDVPPSRERQPALADSLRVVHLGFDVVRVNLPLDGIRDARKVWNHVDELRVDTDTAACLARNGLRLGVTTPDSWAAIGAILDGQGVETRTEQLLGQQGMPVTIRMGAVGDGESIFEYGFDGRLAGKTFRIGEKLLTIDYAFRPQFGGSTDLRVGFEVRHDRGVMTWERYEGGVRQVPAHDRHMFEAVASTLTLRPGEILVIGTNEQADNEYLIGSRFLTTSRAGRRSETLLFVTPKPFQMQGASRERRR